MLIPSSGARVRLRLHPLALFGWPASAVRKDKHPVVQTLESRGLHPFVRHHRKWPVGLPYGLLPFGTLS